MKGSNSPNSFGYPGSKGVSNPLNNPQAKDECNGAWTDKNNNLWIYGAGFSNNFRLWKFEINTNEWTWIKGDSLIPTNYGIKGEANIATNPGEPFIYAKWKDYNDELWFYAATGWCMFKYNITENCFILMNGGNGGGENYESTCTPASNNSPGFHNENRACWSINCENFAFYSGSWFNDLWDYNINTDMWTLLKGDTIPFTNRVYGSKGISNPNNTPDARNGSIGWKDKFGNLWLFGGEGNFMGTGLYNDMWRFVPDINCFPPTNCIPDKTIDSIKLFIPNVFSPNGDGFNDFFDIRIEHYKDYHLRIFNRWGEKVFESTDKNNEWNGKINNTGGEAPHGTYYYLLNVNDLYGKAFTYKGFLTVIR